MLLNEIVSDNLDVTRQSIGKRQFAQRVERFAEQLLTKLDEIEESEQDYDVEMFDELGDNYRQLEGILDQLRYPDRLEDGVPEELKDAYDHIKSNVLTNIKYVFEPRERG